MLLRLFTGLLLAVAVSAASAAEPGVQDWLKRAVDAARTLNYQGKLVYAHGGDISNLRLTHVRDGDQEWEHLVKVDGKRAEVLRGGNDVIYRSGKGQATKLSSLPAMARAQAVGQHLDTLGQYYDTSVSEGSRIAGREAVKLALKPRDQDRFGFEFYMDKATGLLLKSVMLDETGKPLEVVSFSDLQIGPGVGLADYKAARRPAPPPAGTGNNRNPAPHGKPLALAHSGPPLVKPAAPAASAPLPAPTPTVVPAPSAASGGTAPAALGWQLWLPAGFSQIGPVRHKRINGAPLLIATYSDGLSSFSFFSEQLNPAKLPAASQRQRGSTAVVSRQRTQGDKAWLVTVVGELPLAVAGRIADSAVPAGL
jgi:sigma-E factor negative regulatory protein RseB